MLLVWTTQRVQSSPIYVSNAGARCWREMATGGLCVCVILSQSTVVYRPRSPAHWASGVQHWQRLVVGLLQTDIRHHHCHRDGMSKKPPPLTEKQNPGNVTTLKSINQTLYWPVCAGTLWTTLKSMISVLYWPVCAGTLRRQVHAILSTVTVIHDLTQTKVCDLDLTTAWPTAQQDVACTTVSQ